MHQKTLPILSLLFLSAAACNGDPGHVELEVSGTINGEAIEATLSLPVEKEGLRQYGGAGDPLEFYTESPWEKEKQKGSIKVKRGPKIELAQWAMGRSGWGPGNRSGFYELSLQIDGTIWSAVHGGDNSANQSLVDVEVDRVTFQKDSRYPMMQEGEIDVTLEDVFPAQGGDYTGDSLTVTGSWYAGWACHLATGGFGTRGPCGNGGNGLTEFPLVGVPTPCPEGIHEKIFGGDTFEVSSAKRASWVRIGDGARFDCQANAGNSRVRACTLNQKMKSGDCTYDVSGISDPSGFMVAIHGYARDESCATQTFSCGYGFALE